GYCRFSLSFKNMNACSQAHQFCKFRGSLLYCSVNARDGIGERSLLHQAVSHSYDRPVTEGRGSDQRILFIRFQEFLLKVKRISKMKVQLVSELARKRSTKRLRLRITPEQQRAVNPGLNMDGVSRAYFICLGKAFARFCDVTPSGIQESGRMPGCRTGRVNAQGLPD